MIEEDYAYVPASPVRVIRNDGSVEEQAPYSPRQLNTIVKKGQQRYLATMDEVDDSEYH